jgi:hypothetical protein
VNHPIDDPYGTCEHGRCNHDLARAVTLTDLLSDDGPFPHPQTIVNLTSARSDRPTLFDAIESAPEVRRAG